MVENLSRWLRSVRPKTLADDDWATTPDADELLASVHRTIAANGQARPATRSPRRLIRRWAWLPAGAIAGAAVALALVSSDAPPSTPAGPSGIALGPNLPAIRPAAMLLDNYTSCADLLTGLRTHAAAHPRAFGSDGPMVAYGGIADSALAPTAAAEPAAAAPAPTGPADTSTTNVQEIGVDEPDIVKTDGGRLISITDGVLRVVDAASRKITGSLDLTMYQGAQDAQLLVNGDHALVILGNNGDEYAGPMYYRESARGGSSLSTYLFVDLNGQPKVTGSLRASGSYLDARMVGTTIRLVVSSSPAITVPSIPGDVAGRAKLSRVVAGAPLTAWVPQYSITDGADTTKYSVPCNQISHPAHYTAASMLTVYTLDLTHLAAPPHPISVAADGDTVYATASSLYVASNPNGYCCEAASPKQHTEIHRFDITGSKQPTYLGSGQVSGQLLSQYSLSDYAGSLRVATTAGASSSVFVLDADTLTMTGQVSGLGAGEQIYAVRFEGPTAYVVTFKQTDPLYVLDLADPSAPKLVGSLTLTGYSDYLHDAGDGRLIGVGQEASAQGRVAGLQVSLFNVRNPAKPRRTGHVVLAHSRGEDTLDPHAFLYWEPTGLLVVPVQSWTSAQSGKVLVLSVSGTTLRQVGELANPRSSGSVDDGLGIQRTVLVGGALWTVSGSGVQVSDATTLGRQAWIPFS